VSSSRRIGDARIFPATVTFREDAGDVIARQVARVNMRRAQVGLRLLTFADYVHRAALAAAADESFGVMDP